ncbi:M48 family metallopeptidase [Parasalinivibrio latis]|uniref:M48 family metallopeptidase n=1 Tax=Parasalinivibrio latis TaxID=2952610 RepID=UPI0030DE8897
MNFFAHQEKARKRTGLLVMLFFLAVVAISVILSLIVGAVSLHYSENYVDEAQLLQYSLLCFAGVSLVVFCAMLIRLSELARSGGTAIATKLGGRLVSSNSQDPKQRQLLNVVEEMAIASGMPVPPVYLLENEPGINAFAAGMGVDDAVVGITQGALDAFNRDELQGVIAHEFSHILNGDMRINTRLMAYLFGIMFLGQIGAFVLEMSSSSSRRSRSSDSKGAAAIMLIGLAFLIVGWIGTFFGSMIKAAISRQREFLADASAVQFTRNDQGILGALLKIGASASKSLLYSNSAKEASHMMFGQCQAVGLNNLFATHPPLEARIRRIQPGRDGTFGAGTAHANHSTVSSFGGATRSFAGSSYVPLDSVIEGAMPPTQIGTYGERVISQIPIELAALARDPFSARFIPILLIFDGSEAQREIITEYLGSAAQEKKNSWLDFAVPPQTRLALLELATPALKSLSDTQKNQLLDVLETLSRSDNRYSLAEWSVISLTEKLLWSFPLYTKQNKTLRDIQDSATWVLNQLARVCHSDDNNAELAFSRAKAHLDIGEAKLLNQKEDWNSTKAALQQMVQLKPLHKERFLEACRYAIESDGKISVDEAELYRVIACFLEVPISPLLPDDKL